MVGVGAGGSAFEGLSVAARSVWAKHDRGSGGWVPLWRHMADSGAVAGRLWDRWLPGNVRGLIAGALPGGEEDGRALVVWLATVHDIGKCTPAFACQTEISGSMRDAGLDMPGQERLKADRRVVPHGLAGQVLLQEWLAGVCGWSPRVAGQFAVAVGGHHGAPPGYAQLHDAGLYPHLLRTPGPSERVWRSVQEELMAACAAEAGVEGRLRDWGRVRLPQPVQVLLGAVVIVADWIASNADLFPYFPDAAGVPGQERVEAAWRGLDLPAPWAPELPSEDVGALFEHRFALPAGARVRPVQEEAVRLARRMPVPGLLIVEAPMGEGKTEAALAAAEVLAARSGAGGCFVALPTRATSNAMFARVEGWLRRLPGQDPRSVFLAHAKAALDERYAGLLRASAGRIEAVEVDGPEAVVRVEGDVRSCSARLVAHQWLRGRKKGMLASFAAGTIDQLLFAGLKSRHLVLRHLAVAGKVVIVDEVHAYDAYMSVYLERVLEWLGAYGVPVVMLSATLPASRRLALARAYAGGAEPAEPAEESGYPLLTAVPPSSVTGGGGEPAGPVVVCPPASGRAVEVDVEAIDDDLAVLADRLEAELAGGGCALVIRNTVDRVQQTAERLRERLGAAAVMVAHARFVDLDRARKDDELLALFGPDGDRPPGPCVLVASQVAEQSLDVDFDLLVTDLAPVDLLLQRMGRLHRHERGGPGQLARPSRLRRARCLVTGADWGTAPPEPGPGPVVDPVVEPVAGSVAVYGRHALLRAAAVLRPHLAGAPVRLPGDIHPLVQRAYADTFAAPAGWEEAMDDARREHLVRRAEQASRAEEFRLDEPRRPGRSLVGWVDAGTGDADDTRAGRAQVRDGAESLEVIVVRRRADGTLATLPWLPAGAGDLELPTGAVPPARAARAAAGSALRLPYHFCRPWMLDKVIAELERFKVEAWQVDECHWLAGELILVLDEECRTTLAGFDLSYDSADGLRVTPAGARDVRLVNQVPGFDLVARPWLPVLMLDGSTAELSLREVFDRSGRVRRLAADLPTQDFALLRLLLAIAHDALDGPADLDAWEELWSDPDALAPVGGYLDRYRDRFDLLHPERPFFQVAGLRTEKGDVASLNRIVADVPNGDPFFTTRMPGVDRLSFAEAARWVVHAHAFDTSGIKSGAVGDPRVKGGKGYPQGVAWAGNLGGVFAEGATLRETLLLNLIAADSGAVRAPRDDLPAWRRPTAHTAAPADELDLAVRPAGPRDLYTWQSRRIRLEHDGAAVTGVVLAYGDPLHPGGGHHRIEPMTAWRRSKTQEKKLGRPLVYMPREHDPARVAWRGLASLLFAGTEPARTAPGAEPASEMRPGIVQWIAELAYEQILDPRTRIRARIVGARYGTQQSVIDEVVDDAVTVPVILLHEHDPRYAAAATTAVTDADNAVTALGDLAADLAQAAGVPSEPRRDTARDLGFAALDGPFRRWLIDLGSAPDPGRARTAWQHEVRALVLGLARDLLDAAGPAAWEGRVVTTPTGPRWLNDSRAEQRFRARLNQVLGPPPGSGDDVDRDREPAAEPAT